MNPHVELEDLSALLDGELEEARAAMVRAHLESCPECEARRSGLQRSVESLRSLGRAAPPPGLLQRVQRQTAKTRPQPSLLDRFGGWLDPPALRPAFAAALAMVSVAVLAVYGFHAYSTRQEAAAAKQKSDQLLEAYVRSGIPPGPAAEPSAPRADQNAPAPTGSRGKEEGAAANGAIGAAPPPAAVQRLARAGAEPNDARSLRRELEDKVGSRERAGAAAPVSAGSTAAVATGATAAAGTAPEAPAPSAVSVPEAASDAAPEPLLESRRMTLSPAKRAVAPAAPARRVAGKVFERFETGWRERGVARRPGIKVLTADSAAGRDLLSRLPGLSELLADGPVVLRDGADLVELRPGPGR